MKIAIIENPRPPCPEHYNDVANAPLSASLNSGYALAIARRAGWDAVYLDMTASRSDAETVAAGILGAEADLILFHWVYSWGHESTVCRIMDLIRCTSHAPMGAFGLFPTLSRDRLLSFAPQLDFIIAGEFEQTLEELLLTFEAGRGVTAISGLALRDVPYVPREPPDDLSWLPVPDDVGANCNFATMNIAASRGCFGNCGFCFIHRFYGCSRRREREVAAVEAEIEARLLRRNIEQIYFVDPTFIGYGRGQKERAAAISGIAHSAGIPFGFETRVDTVDEETAGMLARNGASSIFLGIESGCDSVLQRINKNVTPRQIERAVRCIRDSGIRLTVGFIMFEPDSTLPELAENYTFLENLGLLDEHELTANLLYHSQILLCGSASWERFEREGRLLLDVRLPFEAGYRFKNTGVARVCGTMRRMATEYFLGMDRMRGAASGQVDGAAINGIVKDAFRASVRHAASCTRKEYDRREEQFLGQLRGMFPSLSPHTANGQQTSCTIPF